MLESKVHPVIPIFLIGLFVIIGAGVFQQLQAMFADVMTRCLEEIDKWIMTHRDHTQRHGKCKMFVGRKKE